MVAATYNQELKAYFERKVAEGKNKIAVLNAVRNKLIHQIFACIRTNRNGVARRSEKSIPMLLPEP